MGPPDTPAAWRIACRVIYTIDRVNEGVSLTK
jgi:hypothetical protein